MAGSSSSPVSTVGWVATTGIGPSAVSSTRTGTITSVGRHRCVGAVDDHDPGPRRRQAHHVAVDPVGQLVLDEPGLAQPGQQRAARRGDASVGPAAGTSEAP